jgi:hypothetical protein
MLGTDLPVGAITHKKSQKDDDWDSEVSRVPKEHVGQSAQSQKKQRMMVKSLNPARGRGLGSLITFWNIRREK